MFVAYHQVAEMTRVIAVNASKALSTSQLSILSARSRNVLTTGDCPVYKLFLRRTLALLRHTLVEGGMQENRFVEELRKVGGLFFFSLYFCSIDIFFGFSLYCC